MISQLQKTMLQPLTAAWLLHAFAERFRQKLRVSTFQHRGRLLHLFLQAFERREEVRQFLLESDFANAGFAAQPAAARSSGYYTFDVGARKPPSRFDFRNF